MVIYQKGFKSVWSCFVGLETLDDLFELLSKCGNAFGEFRQN